MSNIRTYRVNHAMQMISIPLHSTTNSYHLGNNDEVVDAKGVVQQVTNYYPFGAPYADASATLNPSLQAYKYNGKELDHMHGLNTYDYGARQYNPVTGRWDRMDPLSEKYYSTSPYAYCANNPVNANDPDGRAINWLLGGAIGAGVELASQLIEQYDGDMSVMDNLSKNVNWTNVAIAAGEGTLTSGVSALKGVGAKVAVSAISSATKEVSQQIKEGAKSYKDINLQKVGKNVISSIAITGAVGKFAKTRTDIKFKGAKATPQNAIKHKRAGQKRYSKSSQRRANRNLRKQKEEYTNKVEGWTDASLNLLYSTTQRGN